MPDFPLDARAFTCRIRESAGSYRMVFAPAGGLGWSQPCCNDGHSSVSGAATHGGAVLTHLLTRDVLAA